MTTSLTSAPAQSDTMNEPVGVIVMAAGYSRRFGAIKLHATLPNGHTVLEQTLSRIAQATRNIIVISRADLSGIRETVDRGTGGQARLAICADAQRGMGHTLACGIRNIPAWNGCLVCLADMPFIAPATYSQLLGALRPDRIVLPEYAGRPGNPVGFGSHFFSALLQVQGDAGGREVLRQHDNSIQRISVDDPAILQDIDTPEDLIRHH